MMGRGSLNGLLNRGRNAGSPASAGKASAEEARMKFTFKFLLANGRSEYYTFTASVFKDAHRAACVYSRLAFRPLEVMDFYYVP